MKREWHSRIWTTIAARAGVAALIAVLTASVLAAHAEAGEPLTTRIRLRIDRSIAPRRIAAELRHEAEAIWQPYGVRLEWVDAGTTEPGAGGVSVDVTVVRRVTGAARVESVSILGRTFLVPEASVWRPIWVSFDAVADVLTERTAGRVSGTAAMVLDIELARALGRVIAHEIGHVLINAIEHDSTGLMRATFSPNQLAALDRWPFRLTCATADRLRHRLQVLYGGAPLVAQFGISSCLAGERTATRMVTRPVNAQDSTQHRLGGGDQGCGQNESSNNPHPAQEHSCN
jgi:hypothetical protein